MAVRCIMMSISETVYEFRMNDVGYLDETLRFSKIFA